MIVRNSPVSPRRPVNSTPETPAEARKAADALFREDRQVRRYRANSPTNVEAVSVVGAGVRGTASQRI